MRIEDIVNVYKRFSNRERIVVISGLSFIIIFLLYEFFINPIVDYFYGLDRKIAAAERSIRELESIRTEYLALKALTDEIEKKVNSSQPGSIFSQLEEASTRAKVRDYLVYVKPSVTQMAGDYREIAVEARWESLNLSQIINLIYEIEHSPVYLRIKRLNIKSRFDDQRYKDVLMIISTFEPAERKTESNK